MMFIKNKKQKKKKRKIQKNKGAGRVYKCIQTKKIKIYLDENLKLMRKLKYF